LAAALKKEPGLNVELVDGDRGELTVLLDGREMARKEGSSKPSAEQVLSAVRKGTPVGTEA